MIMVQLRTMCKETRILVNQLSDLAAKNNTTPIFTANDIMCGEWLCMKYFTQPMLSVINHDIAIRKAGTTSKQFQFSYWSGIIPSKLKNAHGVMREDASKVGIPGNVDSFAMLCNYLPVDYSIFDAYRIYNMITTHTQQMIQYGIQIAKSNDVYSIAYVEAVIKKEEAISNIKRCEVQKILDRATESDAILNKQKIQNTHEDIEAGKQHWQNLIEDAEIEKALEDIYGY